MAKSEDERSVLAAPNAASRRLGRLTSIEGYEARISAELRAYEDVEQVHDLPPTHDFWTSRYVDPLFSEVGLGGIDDLFERAIVEQCARRAPESATLISLGSGNGEVELPLAARLTERGVTNLELVLLELNPVMIERALDTAAQLGLADRVRCEQTDLNTWTTTRRADIYLAIHSLHHVVELEHLYNEIAGSLDPEGVVLVNDMIGRNGHVRWPEAAAILARIWSRLPDRLRRNNYGGEIDLVYPDIDCSADGGFEGVRSQDVLPELLKRFHPEYYLTFANVIDPFIDRVYGPNFDLDEPGDVAFIESVARLDDAALDLAVLTPTHMVASFRGHPVQCRYPRERSPDRTAHRLELRAESEAELSAEVQSLRGQLAALQQRYDGLRQRRSVRGALSVADRVSALRAEMERRRRHER